MAAIFWHAGKWYEEEQPKLLGPMDHAMWMASIAFDGARGFDGLAPDLDRHCARLIDSARKMLLEPTMTAEQVEALCREALRRLPRDLPTFLKRFGTDAKCRAYLVRARWPAGFCCTGCGHDLAYSHRKRLIEECTACGKQHSILADTIF